MLFVAKHDIRAGEVIVEQVDMDCVEFGESIDWPMWEKSFVAIDYELHRDFRLDDENIQYLILSASPKNHFSKYQSCGACRSVDKDLGASSKGGNYFRHYVPEHLDLVFEALMELAIFTKKHIAFIDGRGPDPNAEEHDTHA